MRRLGESAMLVAFFAVLLSGGTAPGQETDREPGETAPKKEAKATPGEAAENKAPTPTLREIVVTATRVATPVGNVPADVTVVTEERLKRPGTRTFQDALSDVPGVRLGARQDGDAHLLGLELRGLDTNPTSGTNVLVMLDGIPMRRLAYGGPYVTDLPFEAMNRMELVKGPMSSLYGRGALAGALQVFTGSGSDQYEMELRTAYEGTVDRRKAGMQVSGPIQGLAGGSFSLTSGVTETGGWQPRTECSDRNAYLHATLPMGGRDSLDVIAGYSTGSQEKAAVVLIDENGERLSGIDRDANLSVPDQNTMLYDQLRQGLAWKRNWVEGLESRLTVAHWGADTTQKVGRPYDRPASGTIVDRPSQNRIEDEESWYSELQLKYDFDLGRNISGSLVGGANLEYSTFDSSQQRIRSPGSTYARGILLDLSTMVEPDPSTWEYEPWTRRDADQWDHGFFLKSQASLFELVDVEAGARFDEYKRRQINRTTGNRMTVDGEALSPGAGLSVHILKDGPHMLTAYGSWGKGFSPVFRSQGTTEIVELDPETSESYEAGLKGAFWDGLIEGTLAAYRIERNDVILSVGGIPSNAGDWRVQGVEVGLKARPVDGLAVYGNYTRRSPEIEEDVANPANDGNQVPFVSEDMFTLGVEYSHPCGVSAGLENRYTGRCFADSANDIRLDGYNLIDARVGYRWKTLTAALYVRNLLDEEYYSAVWNQVVYGAAFEGTPRVIGVSLSVGF